MHWNDFVEDTWKLSQKIDFQPEIIIGVTRGGVIPARLLCTFLNVEEMHCLWVQRLRGKERKIASTIAANLNGKKVLIVDDMMETSGVMTAAKKYILDKGAIVKTACLYTMPFSENLPDYSYSEVKEVQVFPWEKESKHLQGFDGRKK